MSNDPYERQKRHLANKRDAGWRQVKIDLSPEQTAKLDKARGSKSRAAFVSDIVLKEIGGA